MSHSRVKKCFVALPLDEVVVADVGDVMDGVSIEGMRRMGDGELHVTVKYLGDVEDPELPGVMDSIREVARGSAGFELVTTGFEYFPDARRARVLVVGMEMNEALKLLVERMEDAMEEMGFRREGRVYRPHVTVGRFKKPPRYAPEASSIDLPETGCWVDRVVLMESVRGGSGAEYVRLAEMGLKE